MFRLQLRLRFSPLSWSDGGARNRDKAGEIESTRGRRPKSCSRSNRELQIRSGQGGADETVLVSWGQVYLALQIAPSSSVCISRALGGGGDGGDDDDDDNYICRQW